MSKILRCAIYTRKSTEEGLEQDFNSLDAQREACEAYVRSQTGLGWKLRSKGYDDGGISGGTMDRPALQQLLADIKARLVDVVVVYKIDRLTRSLMDFSKIVEVFDNHNVSFVSVTQQFNTTTSMGRLTLNVLLSFAQFEREVTAERIRDKIAASKKKGMWMGGQVPLGYDLKDRHLYVNEQEAETVRQLFTLYLETESIRRLKAEADRRGILTKHREYRNGEVCGAKAFQRGHLYRLLSNPIYLGQIEHHGAVYDGQHEAIIDQVTWGQVQHQLSSGAAARRSAQNVHGVHLLTGLAFDETGDRLSPTHCSKKGRRYLYYTSNRLLEASRKEKDGWRLPARTLEQAVIAGLNQFLNNPTHALDLIHITDLSTAEIESLRQALADTRDLLATENLNNRQALLQSLITRIDLEPGQIRIEINRGGLLGLIRPQGQKLPEADSSQLEPLVLSLLFTLKQRGIEAKIVLANESNYPTAPDTALIGLLAKAQRWLDLVATGSAATLEELAKAEGADPTDISRILPLAFLAPNIVEAIVEGQQPVGLTLMRLKRQSHLSNLWQEQRTNLEIE